MAKFGGVRGARVIMLVFTLSTAGLSDLVAA